jgi:hypothetical protein
VNQFEARLETDDEDAAIPLQATNAVMVRFLQEYSTLCSTAEQLCRMPLSSMSMNLADISPDSLPRETAAIRRTISNAPKIGTAFRVKDEMIWKLTQTCVYRLLYLFLPLRHTFSSHYVLPPPFLQLPPPYQLP